MESQVVEYKGYLIEVTVERVSTFFSIWRVRQAAHAGPVVGSGALSREFPTVIDAEDAAIDNAKAFIDRLLA